MNEYTLTYQEAIEQCLQGKGFIRGNDFDKGVYVRPNKDGILVVVSVNQHGWHEEIMNYYMNDSTVFRQKYKLFSVASKKELGLEG
jgi:hypothetical protein